MSTTAFEGLGLRIDSWFDPMHFGGVVGITADGVPPFRHAIGDRHPKDEVVALAESYAAHIRDGTKRGEDNVRRVWPVFERVMQQELSEGGLRIILRARGRSRDG